MSKTITLSITGMHCVSCAMNIDGELEDTGAVESASTNYAKSEATITYDPVHISSEEIVAKIATLGYTATIKE